MDPIDHSAVCRALPGFQIVPTPVGRGGQATVFAGTTDSGDDIVVKVYQPNVLHVDRLEQEIEKLNKVTSPSINRYVSRGSFSEGGVEYRFIVLGRVIGTALREDIQSLTFGNQEQVKELLVGGVAAIDALWAHRILHRDIKPENIIRTADNCFVLIDLGLAKAAGDLSITEPGQVVGTVGYIAPERLATPKRPDTKAIDLFSLGVTAYEYACGSHPFGRSQQLINLGQAAPTELYKAAKWITPELSVVVDSLIARDPLRRLGALSVLRKVART